MSALQPLVDDAVKNVLETFAPKNLGAKELAVTLVDLSRAGTGPQASHRGEAPFYPASVIKMFYLAAAHRWLEDGTILDSKELRRGLRDMIVDSGNEATGYVLDVLTDTTSGPELPTDALAAWHEKRDAVNRWFRAQGYADINANRKTWNEGPYGRDKQAVDHFVPSRNSLTANMTARLFVEIATGRCVSAARCREMLGLMHRDFTNPETTDYQGREFMGAGLPPTAKLWSKAGDMSTARHDAAIVELAAGKKIVLVILTTRPDEKGIIPALARHIVAGL